MTTNTNIDDVFTNGAKQGFHERVSVMEIRPNPHNFYREGQEDFEEEVEMTAAEQLNTFQMQDLIGYYDEKDDGKSVTLVSGEKRWRAALLNFEKGLGSEYLEFLIIPKPQSVDEELIEIIRQNNHTDFSKEVRAKSAKILWDILEKTHPDKTYNEKSEMIAKKLGKSSRSIRNYLQEYKVNPASQKSALQENVDAMENEEMEEDILRKQEVKERLEHVGKEIEERLATPAKLKQTKKKGYILSFNLENSDDLLGLLSILNCEDVNLNGLD